MESFYESIVKHHKTPKERLLDIGLFAVGIIGAVIAFSVFGTMMLHGIGAVAAATVFFFAMRAIALNRWEYEYIITAGVIDIDKIIAQRKRKRMLSFDARDCEIIAPVKSGNYYAEYKNLPVLDYTAYEGHEDNYFAVFERAGARTCVLFQPTEDMVQMCKSCNPRNVYIA